jgi:Cft2 family RNA processing exonuclease
MRRDAEKMLEKLTRGPASNKRAVFRSMEVQFLERGIYLPALDLWLDPKGASAAAWLSHAHSDHARGVHGLALGTRETLDIYDNRWPDKQAERHLHPLEPRTPFEFRGARLTPYPAAHILGAAQLLIEYEGERVLYTGDIKRNPPLCGWETETPVCDRLIIESTFGLPVFHFLSREEATGRITGFARECLASGAVPAYFGYPLGRGQEVAHVLCQAGIPTMIHGAIARYLPFYERVGVNFPGWRPYEARAMQGHAVVVTPGLKVNLEAAKTDVRMALVSGWAMFDSARARTGADELIPYSDHAGFAELLEIVQDSGARRVDVVHGYADAFAGVLREMGVDAEGHHGADSHATSQDESAGEEAP